MLTLIHKGYWTISTYDNLTLDAKDQVIKEITHPFNCPFHRDTIEVIAPSGRVIEKWRYLQDKAEWCKLNLTPLPKIIRYTQHRMEFTY